MDEKKVIRLQKWWMEQIQEITRNTIAAYEKRKEKAKAKAALMIGDLGIEKREDIDDLYGYGTITEKQRDKLIDLFEKSEEPDELYEAKIALLEDAYSEAKRVLRDLGQEV